MDLTWNFDILMVNTCLLEPRVLDKRDKRGVGPTKVDPKGHFMMNGRTADGCWRHASRLVYPIVNDLSGRSSFIRRWLLHDPPRKGWTVEPEEQSEGKSETRHDR